MNIVLEEIKNLLPTSEQESFVYDGLCFGKLGFSYLENYKIDSIWRESARRILVLSKEPNANDGNDFRGPEYDGSGSSLFFTKISKCLFYLNSVVPNVEITPVHLLPSPQKVYSEIPVAYVNIKKSAEGGAVKWPDIWSAERTGDLIKKQVKIIDPNIVLCCGSTDSDANTKG